MRFSSPLKLNHVFRRLYRKGNTAADRLLAIYCRRNGLGCNRIGLTVSAKLGHAVKRNRVRRRLREIYRLHEPMFRPGWDIVVVVRGPGLEAPYAKLEQSYLSLAEKLALLERKQTL